MWWSSFRLRHFADEMDRRVDVCCDGSKVMVLVGLMTPMLNWVKRDTAVSWQKRHSETPSLTPLQSLTFTGPMTQW